MACSPRLPTTAPAPHLFPLPPIQVSQALASQVHDSFILKEVEGSDHVPIGLVLKSSA